MFELDPMTKDPVRLVETWISQAFAQGVPEADAMALATATLEGAPSVRVVLFKGVEDGKIFFYTNYISRKSKELMENPRASIVIYWPQLKRQIRVEGKVSKATAEQSTSYFNSRPRESRLASMSSHQSQKISGRGELEARFAELLRKYPGETPIPRPESWGGFAIEPHLVELWKAGDYRLHDRLVFEKKNDSWVSYWVSP